MELILKLSDEKMLHSYFLLFLNSVQFSETLKATLVPIFISTQSWFCVRVSTQLIHKISTTYYYTNKFC